MILLCSLGISWPVVAEAFLRIPPGVNGFKEVHVITTSEPKLPLKNIPPEKTINHSIQEVSRFFTNYPKVLLTISRVKDFDDLRLESDHFRFEEVLYRWVLQHRTKGNLHFCLAGGFKTMSATMQKAAALFGATEVFHVLADISIKTTEQVLQASAEGEIHYIALGSESGWPQFSKDSSSDFPLITGSDSEGNLILSSSDDSLRSRVKEIVERSHHIAASWNTIANLPFSSLAAQSPERLEWLKESLHEREDRDWVKQLPKVELHCHLGGFATYGDLLQQVRAAASFPSLLPEYSLPLFPDHWPTPRETVSLDRYMALGDATGSKLLKDPGCLKKQCELLYDALIEDYILYAEIRCSPNNYVTEGRSAWTVLSEIRETFDRCMKAAKSRDEERYCHLNLIVIATRKNTGDRSDISRHLSLAITASQHWTDGVRVVGVDLAGFESKESRAELFETDFEAVHRVGLAVTAHAGENDDAEGIWQAVFKLNARRLGHALHLKQSADLLRSVADRGIGIEMCPYANDQIKGFHPMKRKLEVYPLLDYLKAGCRVSVNTDNIGISAASLTENILYLATLVPGIRRMDLLQLQRNALETAFVAAEERNLLLKRYETVSMGE